MRSTETVIEAHTVAELIAALETLPGDARVHSVEPPFTGVTVYAAYEPDGTTLIAPLRLARAAA